MNVGAIGGRDRVEAAIRSAASATGVDFAFLLKTAKRESALNPLARARTSSAAGLFQFVEQTWLSTVKTHGAKHGYGHYADLIERGAGGRLSVSGEARRKVLDLRLDATASSLMAAELASDHASYLRGRIGREPTGGELYAAHFLGPVGSAKLIAANAQSPGASAASLFPAAAGANRPIFYRDGAPRSVADVYASLTSAPEPAAVSPRPRSRAPARAILPTGPMTYAQAWGQEAASALQLSARKAAAPMRDAQSTLRDIAVPVAQAVGAVARGSRETEAAQIRFERSRRDDLLIKLVLGEAETSSLPGASLPMELITLLSAARDR